jgi:hypothetical protein
MPKIESRICGLVRWHRKKSDLCARAFNIPLSPELTRRFGRIQGVFSAPSDDKQAEAIVAHLEDAFVRGALEAERRHGANATQETLIEDAVAATNKTLARIFGKNGLPVDPAECVAGLMAIHEAQVIVAVWGRPEVTLYRFPEAAPGKAFDLLEDESDDPGKIGFTNIIAGELQVGDRLLCSTRPLSELIGHEQTDRLLRLDPSAAVDEIGNLLTAAEEYRAIALLIADVTEFRFIEEGGRGGGAAVPSAETAGSVRHDFVTTSFLDAARSASRRALTVAAALLGAATRQASAVLRRKSDGAAALDERLASAPADETEPLAAETEPAAGTAAAASLADSLDLAVAAGLPQPDEDDPQEDDANDEPAPTAPDGVFAINQRLRAIAERPPAADYPDAPSDGDEEPEPIDVEPLMAEGPAPEALTSDIDVLSILPGTATGGGDDEQPVGDAKPEACEDGAPDLPSGPLAKRLLGHAARTWQRAKDSLTGLTAIEPHDGSAADQAMEQDAAPARGLWSRLAWWHKLAGGLMLLLILGTVAAVTINGAAVKRSEDAAARQATLDDVATKLDRAESSMIYKDDARAGALLAEAESALKALEPLAPDEQGRHDQLADRLAESYQTLRRETPLAAPSQTLDVQSDTALMAESGGVTWLIDRTGNLRSASGSEVRLVRERPTALRPVGLQSSASGALVVYEDGSAEEIAADGAVSGRQIIGAEAPTTAVEAFGSRLYLLDAPRNRITRHGAASGGWGAAQFYVEDATSLTGATSLAIDGSIYVLYEDLSVIELFQGKKRPFAAKPPAGAAGQGVRLRVTETDLFVLDARNGRILRFEKQTGDLKTQYVHPRLKGAADFTVSADGAAITFTVASGKELLRFHP